MSTFLFLKDYSSKPLEALWFAPKLIKKSPPFDLLEPPDWQIIQTIDTDKEKLHAFLMHRPFLMANYRVQSAHLLHLIEKNPINHALLEREIEKTLKMAALLEKLYHYMDEPDDVLRASIDQEILTTVLLKLRNPNYKISKVIPAHKLSYSQQLRLLVTNTNLSRLTGIRTRRFILTLLSIGFFSNLSSFVTTIELFTNPFFLYLGWVFFFPRLLLNLIFIGKHIFLNPWMSKENRSIPWYIRLDAYLNLHRRLFELWTDSAWFTGGILLCFALTGAFAPLRPMIVLGMQISDVILMIVRSWVELRRLFILKNKYDYEITHNCALQNPSYLRALNERIAYEKRVSYLAITNNVLMVFALLPLLPTVAALHPLLPLLSALLGLITTVRFYILNLQTEATIPRTNLSLLLKHFKIDRSLPQTQPIQSLLNQLAVPAVITLAPLFFLCVAYSPVLSLLFSITLLGILTTKMTQTGKENFPLTQYNRVMNYNFFKPIASEPTTSKVIETNDHKPGSNHEQSTRI